MDYSHLDRLIFSGELPRGTITNAYTNLALQLFGKDAFYSILSANDKVIQKAVQLEQIAR